MYGMGLGISVWDGSRDGCMGMVLEVGVWDWCMLEGPLTGLWVNGSISRGEGGMLRFAYVQGGCFYTKGLIFCQCMGWVFRDWCMGWV